MTQANVRNRKQSYIVPPPVKLLFLFVVMIAVITISIKNANPSIGTVPTEQSAPGTSVSDNSYSGTSEAEAANADFSAAMRPAATPAPTPPPANNVDGLETESLGSVLIVGNSAYEFYNYSQDVADKYVKTINNAATSLKGKAKLYEMIIPTSISIVLPENLLEDLNTSDQEKAISYFYSSFNSDVIPVNIYNTMMLHRNEYIYFRTDHHWTGLGAYYAYTVAAKTAGFKPLELSEYTKKSYEGYLGSFYAGTENDPALSKKPDTVEAYIPPDDTTMNLTENDGDVLNDWPMIADGDTMDAENKYSLFIGGDNPYTEIINNDTTSQDSCVIVKESFGNAFAPYLTSHYKTVYVLDYRYFDGKVQDFVDEHGIKDVYILNNISATRSDALVDLLSSRF